MISTGSSTPSKVRSNTARTVLIFNAAEDRVQVVLGRDEELVFFQESTGSGRTLDVLPRVIQVCFQQTGLRAEQLDGLALVRGPGTFTGLRVAIALAVGLAKGGGFPLAGLEYLPLLAAGAVQSGREVWVCTYARKGLVYLQGFGPRAGFLTEAAVLSCEEAVQVIRQRQVPVNLVGSGVSLQEAFWRKHLPGVTLLEAHKNHPSAGILLQAAFQAAYSSQGIEPLYLRVSDAELSIPEIAANRGLTAKDLRRRIPDFLHRQGAATGQGTLNSSSGNNHHDRK